MTVLVTVNRFIAVCRPFDATDIYQVKKQARRHVLLVIIFSVLFNASRFFEYEIHNSDSTSSPNKLQESSLKFNPYYKVLLVAILFIVAHVNTLRRKNSYKKRSSFEWLYIDLDWAGLHMVE